MTVTNIRVKNLDTRINDTSNSFYTNILSGFNNFEYTSNNVYGFVLSEKDILYTNISTTIFDNY